VGSRIVRPVVRSFKSRFSKEAAAWVRRGGHAVFWETDKRAVLVFPPPDPDDPHDLGFWAVLDLGKQKFTVEERGPFRGLATTLFPKSHHDIARRRAERDSMWPGPTRTLVLDCLTCAACCKDNEVQLFDVDVERFERAERPELGRSPIARKRDGKLVLTLLPSGLCRYLGKDNKCAIYACRPDACSEFPAGSECCLYSRAVELGVHDGVAPEA